MQLKNSHFLSVEQITTFDTLELIYTLAKRLETLLTQKKLPAVLSGFILLNLFFEPSTRTRLSFAAAFNRLGGSTLDVTEPASTSLVKGESLYDTSRVMSAYADIIVLRHPQALALAEFAEASQVPVINGGNGIGEHPTQALLDIYTILKELAVDKISRLKALTICMVGDLKQGRTVHSLSKLLSLLGNKVTFKLVAPAALQMPADVIAVLQKNLSTVIETTDLCSGVANADVVYMTRIQQERFTSAAEGARHAGSYAIDKAFFEQYCHKNTVLMHPLPRDSRLATPEINADLNQHPNLAIFRQVQNGITVRMALLCLLLGLEQKVN